MQPNRLARGLLAALFFASTAALANSRCPDETDSEFAMSAIAQYEQKLQGVADRCAQDARFLAWHGVVLKWMGDYPQAAELLELALMRAPEMRGTRIDYAETLVALGDVDAGYQLVESLLAEPDLPSALRPHLQARQQRWAPAPWRTSGQATLRAGYDNNLNNATRAREINLNFPDGNVGMNLTQASRARAGYFSNLELAGEAEHRLSARDAMLFLADLRGRLSEQSDTDYLQGEVDAIWRHQDLDNEQQLLLGFNNLAYDGTSLYRQWRLGYTRESRVGERPLKPGGILSLPGLDRLGMCRPHVGADLEVRRYPVVPALDNTFVALRAGYSCGGDDLLRAFVRLGRELAENDRPGGDAWRLDARLLWRRPLLGGWLENDFSLALQQDDRTYSPLLDNGAQRHVERFGWRMEYQWPLVPGWVGLATLDMNRQYSNIKLFVLSGRAFSLGLRYAF